ncbi:MAG TPA: hypothetical protein VLT92_06485 [Burkholderiales bacterium]|nr:hypothetical protein [Burkholderiales bacterium]
MMRRGVAALLLLIWSSASFAIDPLTLILLRMMRDQIISSSAQAVVEGAQRDSAGSGMAFAPSPYMLDDRKLRTLIDEGFVYLTPAQRDEVYASVQRAFDDPKNAALRPMLVQELAQKASAARQAHERLSNLSDGEKKTIVDQMRSEYTELPPEERLQMLQVLQSGVVPIPRDLNDMILAEFGNVQPAAAQSR